jgi:hypothetical protein
MLGRSTSPWASRNQKGQRSANARTRVGRSQQLTLSGTLQNGLTSLGLQIGGGGSIQGRQVCDVWDRSWGLALPVEAR